MALERFIDSRAETSGKPVAMLLHSRISALSQADGASRCGQWIRVERAWMADFLLIPVRLVLVGQVLHDLSAARDGPTGQPASDNLGEGRQIRRDAKSGLRATRRPTEACNDFVKDQNNAVLGRQFPERFEKAV